MVDGIEVCINMSLFTIVTLFDQEKIKEEHNMLPENIDGKSNSGWQVMNYGNDHTYLIVNCC